MPQHYSPPSFIYQIPWYMSPPPTTYQVSLNWKAAPMERDARIQRLSSYISQGPLKSYCCGVTVHMHGQKKSEFHRGHPAVFIRLSRQSVTVCQTQAQFWPKLRIFLILWSDGDTFNHNRILVSSPWRWQDYWPKHVGEQILNKNSS